MTSLQTTNSPAVPKSRVLATNTVLLATALLALWVDLPLAKSLSIHHLYGASGEFFNVAETFGRGFGVLIILTTICTLNPERRVIIPNLLGASIGAGLAANLIKLLVRRERPRAFAFVSDSVADTFGAILRIAGGPPWSEFSVGSFGNRCWLRGGFVNMLPTRQVVVCNTGCVDLRVSAVGGSALPK